jgi:hypothetical protein
MIVNSGFVISWSFRNRLDVFKKSILSADTTCPKNVDFNFIDAASSEETIYGLRDFANTIKDRVIRICESTYRSSLAESWNLGMMLTKNRYVIFSSSDVLFLKNGWFEEFARAVKSGYEYILMENHAVFCIDKKCIPRLGWFDESFVAGPCFDVDYMIRASENNIKFLSIPNSGFYSHGDTVDMTKKRHIEEVSDRLPMNDFTNEHIFKEKWVTSWPGWEAAIGRGEINLPHPPTHISQVTRKYAETDPHPLYTKKYKDLS